MGERFNENKSNIHKVCHPTDTKISLSFEDKEVVFSLDTVRNDKDISETIRVANCNTNEDIIYKQITISGESKEMLVRFVDASREMCEKEVKLSRKSGNSTINISYWRKEYWNLLFKCPKRPLETLYLKEGQKEEIISKVSDFFSEETRGEYIKYGIPYKSVFLLHGVPGSGKTSTIRTIASNLDCDVFVIPISKELTDYGLIDAISYIEEKQSGGDIKKRIIVIEDIDSIFTERKKGDDENGISLQGLLNCFDGFSCIEGTLLFLTANQPEVLDHAILRSCRIDHIYELDYADKYQTESLFTNIMGTSDSFDEFYKKMQHKKYTTAMLQEFLFYNRKCDNIIDKMQEFLDIIDKNNIGHFDKKETSVYM